MSAPSNHNPYAPPSAVLGDTGGDNARVRWRVLMLGLVTTVALGAASAWAHGELQGFERMFHAMRMELPVLTWAVIEFRKAYFLLPLVALALTVAGLKKPSPWLESARAITWLIGLFVASILLFGIGWIAMGLPFDDIGATV